MRIPIHSEGWPFIGLFFVANAILFSISVFAGCVFIAMTVWCIAFFRDPERNVPLGDGLITSPADGRLLPLCSAVPPSELGMGTEERIRLSIFMNVFNVHVNRVPVDGRVAVLHYRTGRFFNASFDKASEHNERMSIRIHVTGVPEAEDLAVIQIAGLVARRIKCDLADGQQVRRGDRFGIIRFGSRLDLYLPPGAEVLAIPKQRVRAGETILARLR